MFCLQSGIGFASLGRFTFFCAVGDEWCFPHSPRAIETARPFTVPDVSVDQENPLDDSGMVNVNLDNMGVML